MPSATPPPSIHHRRPLGWEQRILRTLALLAILLPLLAACAEQTSAQPTARPPTAQAAAPATPTRGRAPVQEAVIVQPTLFPTSAPVVPTSLPPQAEAVAAPAAPEVEGWRDYVSPFYGLSFQYPACLGDLVGVEPWRTDLRPTVSWRTTNPQALELGCGVEAVSLSVYDSATYYVDRLPTAGMLRYGYKPAENIWVDLNTREPADVDAIAIQGGTAYVFGFADAERVAGRIAIPSYDRMLMFEISYAATVKGNAPEPNNLITIEDLGVLSERLRSHIAIFTPDLSNGAPGELETAGQPARAAAGKPLALWDQPEGGSIVAERPLLYEGALVTVVSSTSNAVEVLTAEGVRGWIQHPAREVITLDMAHADPWLDLVPGEEPTGFRFPRAEVTWPQGLPLRVAPTSTAEMIRELIPAGNRGTVHFVSGDWVNISLEDGSRGWMRWFYDGTEYLERVE